MPLAEATVADDHSHAGAALLLAGRVVQLVNGLLLSIILVRRFGLEVVGSFALGIAAVNIEAAVCALGLGAYLPRLKQSHAQSCFAALVLFLAQLPVVVGILWLYAGSQAHDAAEARIIFIVALSGFFIGLQNLGMMLSIMVSRFYPGLLAPLCETVGLVTGSLLSASAETLAVFLLASRVGSVLVIWSGFVFAPVPAARVLAIARTGVRYLAPDVLGLLAEQSAPLLLARVVSRSEFGIFRLCQQLLMAADSLCWTFVQSKYPRMVEGGSRFVELLHGQTRTIALIVSGLCAGLSTALAFTFLATPPVAPLMTVLSFAILWRSKSYLFGQALRAAGHVDIVTSLAAVRLAGALLLFWGAMRLGGLWGAVLALALLSVATGSVYEHAYRRAAA